MTSARVGPGSANTRTPTRRRCDARLDEGAERVAITDNESGAIPDEDQDDWPSGHREGNQAGDGDIREAGENR